MPTFETTAEQRAAARRDQCRLAGHSFIVLSAGASIVPTKLQCRTCGSEWRVHPDDSASEFRTP